MWPQSYTPISDNLALSALVAAMPIFSLLYLLGIARKPAWISSLTGVGVAALVAIFAYRMPPMMVLSSALYGAAFGLQGSNTRSAGNHAIQSTGAIITKELQTGIWGFQPVGIHQWVVRPMNVHDELPTALNPTYKNRVAEFVREGCCHFGVGMNDTNFNSREMM